MSLKNQLDALKREMACARSLDRPALERKLSRVRRLAKQRQSFESAMIDLKACLQKSTEIVTQKRLAAPRPDYPDELPISACRQQIAEAVQSNQVVVIAGETGSGKTTQIPKICLQLGRGATGMIGHTQPRRIAARTVAMRIAEELHSQLGETVGYQVRFHDQVSERSYIKLMTDGILLAEIRNDRRLLRYDTLIIDEAHERSLNIDFLLGYLKTLLPKRPELKLIITSATIDTDRFARHFNAPVIEVGGRTYPVELHYRPLQLEGVEDQCRDPVQGVLDAVDEAARHGPGDALVFLAGERDIRETAEALRKHHPPQTEILPLFARLSVKEQNRIFQGYSGRRIVLATNVAETSLTVPGIRYVIDSGVARISRYSYRSKVQRLPIEKISQASADQRKGRCGRIGPGVCFRLYDEDDFLARPEFTDPEIRRTSLAAVILQMKTLSIGEVEHFPFVDPPDRRFINDGYRLLQELGAVDQNRELTEMGRKLARLPIDPRLGRMILAAQQHQCLHEVLIITSALAIQDPRERPMEKQQKADEAHRAFQHEQSDFLFYYNLWQQYHHQVKHLSRNKLRKWCQAVFLSYRRMQEWHDLHQQLANHVKEMGWRINQQEANPATIHQALLAGLLSNIGTLDKDRVYTGSHGKQLRIHPGSVLAKKQPKWIVAAEMVDTTRLYGRTVVAIQPTWVESLAAHLVKKSYTDAHWECRPAQVAAFESVSLYGLRLVSRRRVNFGPINPVLSREIFIRRALVEGDYNCSAKFFQHNQSLIQQVQELEDKVRKRNILVDEQVLFQFYDERIEDGIYSGKAFEKWRKAKEKQDPEYLYFKQKDLMQVDADAVDVEPFPDRWCQGALRLPLVYHFEPGHEQDGVSVRIPLSLLNRLEPEPFEWLVPGLLREKIVALIKTLPKNLRRNFVPAPEYAKALLESIRPESQSLLSSISEQLQRMTGIQITRDSWQPEQLPPHLQMRFDVHDERGKSLASGRNLERLKRELKHQVQASFQSIPELVPDAKAIYSWDFGELPRVRTLERNGLSIETFPALSVEQGSVYISAFDTQEKANTAHQDGLCELFQITQKKDVNYLRKHLPGIQQMCMAYTSLGSCPDLIQDLVRLIVAASFLDGGSDIRDEKDFLTRSNHARQQLMTVANTVCALVGEVLSLYHELNKRLSGNVSPSWLSALQDIKAQLSKLVYPGFLKLVDFEQLKHVPRYLQAIRRRLEKLEQDPVRDRRLQLEIQPWWNSYLDREQVNRGREEIEPELERFRWMLEELRVSLFAQELKTAFPVSVKRVEQQWRKVIS